MGVSPKSKADDSGDGEGGDEGCDGGREAKQSNLQNLKDTGQRCRRSTLREAELLAGTHIVCSLNSVASKPEATLRRQEAKNLEGLDAEVAKGHDHQT